MPSALSAPPSCSLPSPPFCRSGGSHLLPESPLFLRDLWANLPCNSLKYKAIEKCMWRSENTVFFELFLVHCHFIGLNHFYFVVSPLCPHINYILHKWEFKNSLFGLKNKNTPVPITYLMKYSITNKNIPLSIAAPALSFKGIFCHSWCILN